MLGDRGERAGVAQDGREKEEADPEQTSPVQGVGGCCAVQDAEIVYKFSVMHQSQASTR